jgi:hypothetical protein
MGEQHGNSFRVLQEIERRILERLLQYHEFDGRDELLTQLESTTARTILEHHDNYGSIELCVNQPTPARVRYRVPVEAEYLDDDGVPVWVLLHVNRGGLMCELEICRADGQPLISPPVPERLEPFSANYDALIKKAKLGAERKE